MNLGRTGEEIAGLLAEALRVELQQDEECYLFELTRDAEGRTLTLAKTRLNEVLSNLQDFEARGETAIFSEDAYEILVREESRYPRMLRQRDREGISMRDEDNGVRYQLSYPSDEYLVYLLCTVSDLASPRALVSPMPLRRLFDGPREDPIASIFDLIRRIIPRFLSLRLESDTARSIAELEKYSNAFLFQLSYNTDMALVPQRHVEELIRTGRINRVRRVSLDDLDPPRRHYIPDLIHHYQLAVASDNPFLEFISYYHIAEHFFESVFSEDLVQNIKKKLTSPEFSYKRKKDINSLIRSISRSLQIRSETITFSELEALRLTLAAHVDLEELKNKVDEYDSTLKEYYDAGKVLFSDGDSIDLNSPEEDQLYKRLAARIYKTRNALVHSKESEKAKYTPFKDDKDLVREVPLIRFIAEQIIISSSTVVS